jgi:hypothetical protein
VAIDLPELRRQIRVAIELAKKNAASKRSRSDTAQRDYDAFLSGIAVPTVQQFASALAGEGHLFKVETPADSVRLSSVSAKDDFIELVLDTTQDPPEVVARVSRGRGRRMMTSERPLRERTAVADLKEEDVVTLLLQEITPFLT